MLWRHLCAPSLRVLYRVFVLVVLLNLQNTFFYMLHETIGGNACPDMHIYAVLWHAELSRCSIRISWLQRSVLFYLPNFNSFDRGEIYQLGAKEYWGGYL